MKTITYIFTCAVILSSCANTPNNTESNGNSNTNVVMDTSQKNQTAASNQTPEVAEIVLPENNFDVIKEKFVKSEKDITEITKWVKKVVMADAMQPVKCFTKRCDEFVSDANSVYWDYPDAMDKKTFQKKWETTYDLKYCSFSQIFESGNCGWMSKKLTSNEYLGTLNGGEWFRITINGSCSENDFSEKVIRVIKVVNENDKFLIDNFVAITKD